MLDPKTIAEFTTHKSLTGFIRLTLKAHPDPLGMGYGSTRFASPIDSFKLLYVAAHITTSVAETVVRDRFEGMAPAERLITTEEISDWMAVKVETNEPLKLLNMTGDAAVLLGVSTDAFRGKEQAAGREFSEHVYGATDVDGILYESRLRPGHQCIAVYDRAVDAPAKKLKVTGKAPLDHYKDLALAAAELRFTLV